ncbi:response regulator transcription factor [Paraburkholderia youngii]|uniref:Response regulator n=1 Tax=Paraburkholderia youngii TaxID=2782701 RepID=A0A7Y6K0V5_9BURK|nr:response regulator [Paraburkholderia youngii]NUY01448.1 response regulator [Paraburkholderia youngii]
MREKSVRTKTVCVIDDELAIRQSTMAMARSLGYHAYAFACAEDFLTSGVPERIDCLVCDIQMSGMSGTALLSHMRTLGEVVPFIFVSGHVTAHDHLVISRYDAPLLEKPIEPDELAALLVTILGTP